MATTYAARVPVRRDHATGGRVCAECWADIEHRAAKARFCDDRCRHVAKARRQRARLHSPR